MKMLVFLLLTTISMILSAQEADNFSLLYEKKINDIINEIKTEKDERSSEINKINNDLITRTNKLETSINKIEQQLENIDKSYLINMNRSRIGAYFLMIGLLAEVIGAILLASNSLVAKLEKIQSLKTDAGLFDLSLEDQVQKGVLVFFNGIGSILIIIGFMLQFTGTILVVARSNIEIISILSMGIILPTIIIFYFGSRTPGQTLKEKIRIMSYNLKIMSLNTFLAFMLPKTVSYCDICGKLLKKRKGQIWYIKEDDTKENNSLHKPHNARFGHESCLKSDKLFTTDLKTDSWMDLMNTHKVFKITYDDFVLRHYDQLKQWFIENKADWEIKKGASYKCHYEAELDRLYSRLKQQQGQIHGY